MASLRQQEAIYDYCVVCVKKNIPAGMKECESGFKEWGETYQTNVGKTTDWKKSYKQNNEGSVRLSFHLSPHVSRTLENYL